MADMNYLELCKQSEVHKIFDGEIDPSDWTIFDYALWYTESGFSVIPIKPRNKEPLAKWKEYQKRKPTVDEVESWFKDKTPEDVGIGIVCGPVSGNLVVLDFDKPEMWERLNPTYFEGEHLVSITGSGKRHLYLGSKTPVAKTKINAVGLDIQGEGAYVVAPPSIHPSGGVYRFIDPNKPLHVVGDALEIAKEMSRDLGFKESTATFNDYHEKKLASIRPCIQTMIDGLCPSAIGKEDHGLSHDARMAVANEGFALGLDDLETAELFKNQADYDRRDSIYQVRSLRKTWIGKPYSCAKIREKGWCIGENCTKEKEEFEDLQVERNSHAKQILQLLEEKGAFSFIDQNKQGYLRLNDGNIWKHYPLESQMIYSWLANLLFTETGEVPKREAIKNAITILYAQAQARQYNLSLRVAKGSADSIWIDLCDDQWRAFHVTKKGWTIEENPPLLFKRYDHNAALPVPSSSGKIQDLIKLTTIKDSVDGLLFIIHTLSFWIPDIPHPIMNGFGPQGSCKTSSQRVAKANTDPSAAETLSLPEKQEELILQLDQNYFAVYDNVSRITEERSDDFCKAVSGIGIQKRRLFTDSDSIVRTYRRCIAINGIETTANRGDLLERSILYEHRTPSDEERITDAEFNRRLNELRPALICAMLDTLVTTLNVKDSIVMKRKPRMADFAEWGCAICEALGFPQEVFLDAYENARIENSITVIEASTLARTLLDYLIRKRDFEHTRIGGELWCGNASSLYSELQRFAEENGLNIAFSDFPKNANYLSKSLGRLEPDLLKLGVRVHRGDRTGSMRKIHFIKSSTSEKQSLDAVFIAVQRWLNDGCDENDASPVSKTQDQSRGSRDGRGTPINLPSLPSLMSQTHLSTLTS
jgi:hypothetical protein